MFHWANTAISSSRSRNGSATGVEAIKVFGADEGVHILVRRRDSTYIDFSRFEVADSMTRSWRTFANGFTWFIGISAMSKNNVPLHDSILPTTAPVNAPFCDQITHFRGDFRG